METKFDTIAPKPIAVNPKTQCYIVIFIDSLFTDNVVSSNVANVIVFNVVLV